MIPQSYRTRAAACAAALAIAFPAALLIPADSAHAALGLVSCTGRTDVSYSPGITTSPAPVTSTTQLHYYTCLIVGGGTITKAQDSSTVATLVSSCAGLLGVTPAVPVTVHWNNGQSSTVDATVTTTQAGSALVVTTTGAITSGPFTGGLFNRDTVFADVDALAACQSPTGLTGLGPGLTAMTIASA